VPGVAVVAAALVARQFRTERQASSTAAQARLPAAADVVIKS
jgi:hypothetical protein